MQEAEKQRGRGAVEELGDLNRRVSGSTERPRTTNENLHALWHESVMANLLSNSPGRVIPCSVPFFYMWISVFLKRDIKTSLPLFPEKGPG